MAFQLQDVVTAVRLSDSRFGRDVVSNHVLGQLAGDVQRMLAQLATQRQTSFLAQSYTIPLQMNAGNAPGAVAAGGTGGLPGTVVNGAVDVADAYVGNAIQFAVAEATVLVSDFVPTAVTPTTVQLIGAGWTVNAWQNQYFWVTQGPGANGAASVVQIVSNTADTLTVASMSTPAFAGLVVAGQSVGRVVQTPAQTAGDVGVATWLPALQSVTSYLVKLNAAGQPYLDLTAPLVTHVEQGIPLPPFDKLLGGDVMGIPAQTPLSINGPYKQPFRLVGYQERYRAPWNGGYVLGGLLYLLGEATQWLTQESIDLRYVPIPPLFPTDGTALTSYFLLPDTAYPALVAHAKARAADYAATKGLAIDPTRWAVEAQARTAAWLETITRSTGAAQRRVGRNR